MMEVRQPVQATSPPSPRPSGRPLSVDLWCNAVAGGWGPADLETGLGGGEEALVLWAAALAGRGHRVRVFHNPRPGHGATGFGGAAFLPHTAFDPFEARDVMVSWKSPHPWRVGVRARRRIHWSSDIEPPWPARMLAALDAFVVFTPYHRETMPWLPDGLAAVVPLGVDLAHLEAQRAEKIPGRALYASSPDRGLERLLRDWPRLRAHHPGLTLHVCYGWERFMACRAGSPQAIAFRADVTRLLQQEGICWRGAISRDALARAYWEASYWLHPLDRAESELFCLNAVKAMHAGALAVVNRIGALAHTVTRWVDYTAFCEGASVVQTAPGIPARGWDAVIADDWEPLFKDDPCTS